MVENPMKNAILLILIVGKLEPYKKSGLNRFNQPRMGSDSWFMLAKVAKLKLGLHTIDFLPCREVLVGVVGLETQRKWGDDQQTKQTGKTCIARKRLI